jgi:hypothetical protein
MNGATIQNLVYRGNAKAASHIVLLRHSFCTTAFCCICPQQGHRGKACAKVRARRMRKVAIEFGMWRCEVVPIPWTGIRVS